MTKPHKPTSAIRRETVMITGANRGIGLALAHEFLERNCRVIATAREPGCASDLEGLARDGDNRDGELIVVGLDITDTASIVNACKQVSELCSCLDVLINNAGVFPEEGDELFDELDLAHFSAAFETNVVGTARACRAFLPLLRKALHPRIVNVSSGAGSISSKMDHKYYCYSTSKAALNMFTRALANEVKQSGVIVVALSPGWVKTEMGGPNAQLSPGESARSIAETVGKLTNEDAGHFLGRDSDHTSYKW